MVATANNNGPITIVISVTIHIVPTPSDPPAKVLEFPSNSEVEFNSR